MAAGDLYQIVVSFTNADTAKDLSFTLSGKQPGLVAPSMTAVGDDVKDWWNTSLSSGAAAKSRSGEKIALASVTLRRVLPLEPTIQSYTTGLPIVGASATEEYTAQAAPIVSLRTANIGKSYRGRVFLPPVAEGFVGTSARLNAGEAADIAQQFQDLLDSLAVDAFTPVIWSRKLGIGTEVTAVFVDEWLRTQRRRQARTAVYVAP